MSVNQEFEKTGSIAYLCDEYLKNNFIDPEASERLGVKRGLRNPDGTGVLAGLTNVCDVVGYDLVDGKRVPTDGRLIYRGIDVEPVSYTHLAEHHFCGCGEAQLPSLCGNAHACVHQVAPARQNAYHAPRVVCLLYTSRCV